MEKMEMEHYVKQAADDAVRQVFAILGVDIDKPSEVEEFRANLRFGASVRRAADKGVMAGVGVAFVGLSYALWVGIVSKILKGGH